MDFQTILFIFDYWRPDVSAAHQVYGDQAVQLSIGFFVDRLQVQSLEFLSIQVLDFKKSFVESKNSGVLPLHLVIEGHGAYCHVVDLKRVIPDLVKELIVVDPPDDKVSLSSRVHESYNVVDEGTRFRILEFCQKRLDFLPGID